ncbi:TPA: hypothetical protein ACGBGH_003927 [Pseudomonas aeruginosa]
MSDDNVVPMKKRGDRYEALIRDEAEFDELVLGAIKFGQDHGLPESMMKGILMSAIIDLDFNCIVFEPEDGHEGYFHHHGMHCAFWLRSVLRGARRKAATGRHGSYQGRLFIYKQPDLSLCGCAA